MKKLFITILIVGCGSSITWAQDEHNPKTLTLAPGQTSPAASIEDIAWITGFWTGDGLGGYCEEMYLPPVDGHMIGTFRWIHQDSTRMFEFVDIIEENNTLKYRLKHFNPDLSGWEEKNDYVEFPLVKVLPGLVYFDGLTMKLFNDNEMAVYVRIKRKNGTISEEKFNYKKNNYSN